MINFDYEKIYSIIIEQTVKYLPKVLLAVITLIIGLWVIRMISKVLKKQMKRAKVDPSLRHFLDSLVNIMLKALLLITVISMFGVQMTSFVAVIGAAGLAIGLALQGSLSNFAGGVLILLFKPFVVGDVIEAQGHKGKVDKIQIFNTILKTPDNQTIIIPNGNLSNNDIINYSTQENRRVDITFGIGYDDDIDQARSAIEKVIGTNDKVLKEPNYQIAVAELADSSVNFTTRVWCKGEDYWDVFFFLQENVKKEFDKQNISIPYPQTDVHLHKVEK